MNYPQKFFATLLCLYYLLLAAWAEHQDKARLIS
jgi:hypothetical protein